MKAAAGGRTLKGASGRGPTLKLSDFIWPFLSQNFQTLLRMKMNLINLSNEFSIMHSRSQMSGFMDRSERRRVIELSFEWRLTFNGSRVGPHPRDLHLLNYLARCQFTYRVSSARKVEIFKSLSNQTVLPQPPFGNVLPIKNDRI